MKRIWLAMTAAGLLAAFGITLAESPNSVEITEWPVPWENSRPRDPWVSSPELIWFVGQRGDYVATFNPQTGDFKRYDLDPGTGPHTVIADERGAWYAGNRAHHIGLLDPDSGDVEKIMLPGEGPRDVHTMDFTREGDIWFTVQAGNQVGLLETASREITLYEVPTPRARPYGLIVADDDRPWVTLFGTHKLATVNKDGELKEIELPRAETRPRRLAITDHGRVWYVDYANGYLGRYNPETGDIDEWRTPAGGQARPYAMAADDRGRLWFVETGVSPNRLVGFDPQTQTFTQPVEIESGGGTVRHMVFDAASSALWFGTDTNTLGRARLRLD